MTAKDIIKGIEEHCGETMTCSSRLRYQIEQALQREIDRRESVQANVLNALNGYETFNPKTQKAIHVKS